jgi:hypothetical protein
MVEGNTKGCGAQLCQPTLLLQHLEVAQQLGFLGQQLCLRLLQLTLDTQNPYTGAVVTPPRRQEQGNHSREVQGTKGGS